MFRQASTSFGHALQTGQMGPVLEQFGIGQEAKEAAFKGGFNQLIIKIIHDILDIMAFARKLTEDQQKVSTDEKMETANESTEDTIREPEPKRGKPDDEMDLD